MSFVKWTLRTIISPLCRFEDRLRVYVELDEYWRRGPDKNENNG